MNPKVDGATRRQSKSFPGRAALFALAFCLIAAGAAWGGWYYVNHPPKPWLVRWKLHRYLAGKANTSDFKVDFPFPSAADMAKYTGPSKDGGEPKGSRTGKTFDALREDYFDQETVVIRLDIAAQTNPAKQAELQQRQQRLEPVIADLWELQRQQSGASSSDPGSVAVMKSQAKLAGETDQKLASAESYPPIYRLIGQELWVAERLLESKNFDHRRAGASLALAACRGALNAAMDGGVAARICEAYLMPNSEIANDANPKSPFNSDNFLRNCADIFVRNNEYPNAARVYEMYIAKAPSQQRADWARFQVADAYQQAGDARMALQYLKQVQNTNDNRLGRRIAWLQRQVGR